MILQQIYLGSRTDINKRTKKWRHQSFLQGHWYHCFGLMYRLLLVPRPRWIPCLHERQSHVWCYTYPTSLLLGISMKPGLFYSHTFTTLHRCKVYSPFYPIGESKWHPGFEIHGRCYLKSKNRRISGHIKKTNDLQNFKTRLWSQSWRPLLQRRCTTKQTKVKNRTNGVFTFNWNRTRNGTQGTGLGSMDFNILHWNIHAGLRQGQ